MQWLTEQPVGGYKSKLPFTSDGKSGAFGTSNEMNQLIRKKIRSSETFESSPTTVTSGGQSSTLLFLYFQNDPKQQTQVFSRSAHKYKLFDKLRAINNKAM